MFAPSPGIACIGTPNTPPAIRGSESLIAINTATTPHTISLTTPAQTFVLGDYLLGIFGTSLTATVNAVAGATDDTYAEIREDSISGSNLAWYEGTLGGGALDASIGVTLDANRRIVGGLITISGAAANAFQPNAQPAAPSTGTDTTPIATSITTTVAQCRVFAAFHARGGHNLAAIDAALPSGWTIVFRAKTSAGDDSTNTVHSTLAIVQKVQVAAGATGDATWTDALATSETWSAAQIAIAPA